MDPYTTHIVMFNRLGEWLGIFKEHALTLLIALLLIVVGVPLAELLRRMLAETLPVLGWERFSHVSGLSRILKRIRPAQSSSESMAQAISWLALLSLIMKALAITGVYAIARIGQMYWNWLPGGGIAFGIALVSLVAAHWMGKIILLAGRAPVAELVAGLARAGVWALGLHAGLLALGFEASLVLPLVLILLAGWILALALAWAKHPGNRHWGRDVVRVEVKEESNL